MLNRWRTLDRFKQHEASAETELMSLCSNSTTVWTFRGQHPTLYGEAAACLTVLTVQNQSLDLMKEISTQNKIR